MLTEAEVEACKERLDRGDPRLLGLMDSHERSIHRVALDVRANVANAGASTGWGSGSANGNGRGGVDGGTRLHGDGGLVEGGGGPGVMAAASTHGGQIFVI